MALGDMILLKRYHTPCCSVALQTKSHFIALHPTPAWPGPHTPWSCDVYWSCGSHEEQQLWQESWYWAHSSKRSLMQDGESPYPTPTSPRLVFILPSAFRNTLLKHLQGTPYLHFSPQPQNLKSPLWFRANLLGLVLYWKTFILLKQGERWPTRLYLFYSI